VSQAGDRPRAHNQRSIRKLLEANGWTQTQGGKHVVKMTKPGHRPITVPHDKGGGGYPIGLTIAILRQAGLRGGNG
jgi:predicted RNA binding protein YcfA (HicA-like mRNA interferase family)